MLLSPYRFGAAPTPSAFTKLLLSCDGANASISFPDRSSYAKVVTANGNAKISTAFSQFGGASAILDGAGDYLATAASDSDFALASSDFTIECWARIVGSGITQQLATKRASSAIYAPFSLFVTAANKPAFYCSFDGASWGVIIEGSTVVTLNTFVHWAAVRSGNNFYFFVGGALLGTAVATGTLLVNTDPLSIGATANGNFPTNGYIDEFRFTKGLARYTAAFTPPTAPFVVD